MAIFRGIGGAGDSNTDATITAVTQQATNAANSASAAEEAKGLAEDAQEAAEIAQGLAEDAQEAAETAQGLAETAQEAAETAATNAGNSEDAAADSAEDAAKLAVTVEDTQYTLSDGVTTGYSALHYAAKAEDSATAASTSETNAFTSEGNASTSATNAGISEGNAANSETNAANSADDASKLAVTAEDTQYTLSDGTTTGYSSLHYAAKAASSASAANTSETNAASSASAAYTSETNAAASELAATNAAANAVAAQEAIDGLYLGAQTSDPSVDLNGDPVTAGDWYYNTTISVTRIYDGSVWVNGATNTYNYIPYSFYNSTGTLTNNAGALVDTSGSSFALNLPATPATGDKVFIADVSNSFGTNNLTIAQNGSTIEGVAEDFIIDISNVSVEFIYTGTTWKSYAKVGAYSGNIVTESAEQTLTNKTLTAPIVTDYTESTVAIGTVTTSHTFNLASGTLQTATLSTSTACTFTMPTATTGKSFMLILTQASGGNGTATFTGVKWTGGSAPTITASANSIDMISFLSDGTYWYGSIVQDMQ